MNELSTYRPYSGPMCHVGSGEISSGNDSYVRVSDHIALEQGKEMAYSERDKLVCALSKLFPAHIERHPESDTSWENDWRWIVFIQLPAGQASWHIHDSEVGWFAHLERTEGNTWNGHSTAEKYRRLERIERIDAMASYAALEHAYRELGRERLAYGRTERNKALAEAALLIRNNTRGLQGQTGMYEEIANVLAGWVESLIKEG